MEFQIIIGKTISIQDIENDEKIAFMGLYYKNCSSNFSAQKSVSARASFHILQHVF